MLQKNNIDVTLKLTFVNSHFRLTKIVSGRLNVQLAWTEFQKCKK